MKFWLISRQFSQTFRCFKKSNNFQNDFYEFNPIFSKTKKNMSQQNQPKTTIEDKQKNNGMHSQNKYLHRQSRSQEMWTQNGQNFRLNSSFSANQMNQINQIDPNVYQYNWSSNPLFYNQPFNQVFTPLNGYPSVWPQTAYYPTNGQMNGFHSVSQQMPIRQMSPSYQMNVNNGMYSQQTNAPISDEEVKNILRKYRRISKTKYNDSIDSNDFRFSLMTYNILSQNLLEDHSVLYQHCPPSVLKWPQRGHRVLKELLDSDCDIICLQEVHSQHFEELYMPALRQQGYNSVYKQRTGGKMDGCAVLYKENKFNLLNEIKLDFMRKDLSSVLDRDNIALIVELQPKHSKRDSKVIVANTHLLYNPKRGDVKLAQMRLLMAEIDKIAKISQKDNFFDYNPIILCGDLNSEPNSLIFDFITKGVVNFNGFKVGDISGQRGGFGRGRPVEDHHLQLMGVTSDTRFENSSDDSKQIEKMSIKHNFNLRSIIYKFEDRNRNKLISSANCLDSGLVDYIFYDYKKLRVCGYQRLLTQYKLQQMGGIPNNILGSDHFSIKAIFSII